MKTRFHENWMKADTRAGGFLSDKAEAWNPGLGQQSGPVGSLRQIAGHQTELLSLLMHEWCTIKAL